MAYYEKNFQTDFNKWCKHIFYKTAVFELKISDGKSLPFSDVADHQISSLYAAKHGNLVMKIPDTGFQNPFDSFMMVMVPAYVVIMFKAQERNRKEFIMVDIDTFCEEKRISDRKSLTEDKAKEIGKICFLN